MTRALSSWSRPPRSLRRPPTKLDNVAIVPASELTSLTTWQQRAHHLSAGNTLIVVPCDNLQLQRVGYQIKLTLNRQGRKACVACLRRPSPTATWPTAW
jgi:hypothetical protein